MITDLVLVHGFWSSPATWDRLADRIEREPSLGEIRVHRFGYSSPKLRFPWQPSRIPDYNDIAQTLPAFFDAHVADTGSVAIVTHSQGGLILQRFLAWMLSEGRGHDLARIRLIVMLSCPNEGSEYLRSIRAVLKFNRQPQAKSLRVLDTDVSEARRIVLRQIINATAIDARSCPIPFYVYSGDSDNIVRRASAQSIFPNVGVLPGDHFSILDPDAPGSLTFSEISRRLLAPAVVPASAEPAPEPAPAPDRKLRTSGLTALAGTPTPPKHDLGSELLTLLFDATGDPAEDALLPILEDYETELNQGSLDGYTFQDNQFSIVNPAEHDRLAAIFRTQGQRGLQRRVREMENWYIRGTVALLNLLFIDGKQTSHAWRSVYWFNRAVRNMHVTLMRQALPPSLIDTDYGEIFSADPLDRDGGSIESFYGEPLIAVKLWEPNNPGDNFFCLFPRTGFAGKWFSQHPQRAGEYYPRHFSRIEYHEFLIPQMMLAHIAHNGPLISDFTKFHITAA